MRKLGFCGIAVYPAIIQPGPTVVGVYLTKQRLTLREHALLLELNNELEAAKLTGDVSIEYVLTGRPAVILRAPIKTVHEARSTACWLARSVQNILSSRPILRQLRDETSVHQALIL